MKQIKQKIMLCLLWLIGMGANAETYTGSCGLEGDNVKWSLDTETGVLKLSGSGEMIDYKQMAAPWYKYRNLIMATTVESGITTIGAFAFSNCTYLGSVSLPNSLTKVGKCAFYNCTRLSDVNFPNSVKEIGNQAFSYCTAITSINLPTDLIRIDTMAFKSCSSLESLFIPNNTSTIAYRAFEDCSSLLSVTMPNAIKDVGTGAFSGCDKIDKPICSDNFFIKLPKNYSGAYTIEDGIKTICGEAFIWCTSLTSVNIPTSISTINDKAFYGCSGIKSITITDAVTNIGNGILAYCDGLNKIIHNSTCMIKFPINSSIKYYQIPDGITKIAGQAFEGCVGLSNVTIPSTVTQIGTGAFQGSAITSITIPNTVSVIEDGVFNSCKSLKIVNLPSSVESMGNDVFSGCSALTTVTLHSIPSYSQYTFGTSSTASVKLVLDDTDCPYIANSTKYAPTYSTMNYTRSIGDKYGTIILPFVPENAEDYMFYSFKGCNDGALEFKIVNRVEAGVPYIYKKAEGSYAIQMNASNVDGTTLKVTSTDPSAVNGWQFRGNYANTVLTGTEYYVINNNQFVNTTANVNMIPFRAYLQNMSASAPKSLRIIEDDGEVTCISAADVEGLGQEHGTIYDLSGRRVANSANLKGIYIINGKKVLK